MPSGDLKAYRRLVQHLIASSGEAPALGQQGRWVELYDEIAAEVEQQYDDGPGYV